jgi:hypothetical protein
MFGIFRRHDEYIFCCKVILAVDDKVRVNIAKKKSAISKKRSMQ